MLSYVQNLRIGTKLAIASGLSMLLLLLMILIQMNGNAQTRKSMDALNTQQIITRDALDTKASVMGMQTGVRDVRLARTPADIQNATDYIAARLKSINGFTDEILKLSHAEENRERVAKIRTLAADYADRARNLAAIRSEAIGLGAKAGVEQAPEATAKISKLNDEAIRIARDTTLPIAAELESLANATADFAKRRADVENAAAAAEMTFSQNYALAAGVATSLMLIGTCMFSIFAIARPMGALTRSMLELAKGNFTIVLPGLGRKDEIAMLQAQWNSSRSRRRRKRSGMPKIGTDRIWSPPSSAGTR
jgi:hypothetical protein